MQGAGEVEIIGEDPVFRNALELARHFATKPLPILLVGATGTGKEVLARAIYRWSGRRGPLVDVNCAGLPSELVEGQLFGHRKGAFTGAVTDFPGLIMTSAGGMLFLDQLETLPLPAQAKLLRVLEGHDVWALGATASSSVNLRVVAAAQPELWSFAANGGFRRDLLYRLVGVVIELPDLKRRGEDVVLLARAFAKEHGRELGPGVEHLLQAHDWPGNVRELRAVVEQSAYATESRSLAFSVVRDAIAMLSRITPLGSERSRNSEHLSRADLLELCASHEWRISEICAALGVSHATLYRRLKGAGISISSNRPH